MLVLLLPILKVLIPVGRFAATVVAVLNAELSTDILIKLLAADASMYTKCHALSSIAVA